MATIFAFLVCVTLASSSHHSASASSAAGRQTHTGVLVHEPTELSARGGSTGCQCVVQITSGFNGANGSRGERGPAGSFDPRVPIVGPAPTVAVGAGAGSADAIVAIEGTDMAGTVTVRTGKQLLSSASGKPVFTLTFGQAYPHRPSFVMLQPASLTAQSEPVPVVQDRDAGGFSAIGNSLYRSTVYSWTYLVHL